MVAIFSGISWGISSLFEAIVVRWAVIASRAGVRSSALSLVASCRRFFSYSALFWRRVCWAVCWACSRSLVTSLVIFSRIAVGLNPVFWGVVVSVVGGDVGMAVTVVGAPSFLVTSVARTSEFRKWLEEG